MGSLWVSTASFLSRASPAPPSRPIKAGFEMKGGRVYPALGSRALPGIEYLGNKVRASGQKMTSQVSPFQGPLPTEAKRRWSGERRDGARRV